MRRIALLMMIFSCFAALLLACFWGILFQDQQFGYRDSAHYYYPLYQRVQMEWQAGRWPLWEPEENAGVPLLGNPTAAVLYPGKLVYAFLPYPWANRAYAIAHVLVAFVTMLILMRGFGASLVGSALSALAYAFGVPVLFQYSNIIYLVGAAWLPLGFHAVDSWARKRNAWALLELALVLALQTLGGDPQAAYLLGLVGFGYAAGIAWARRKESRRPADEPPRMTRSSTRGWLVSLALFTLAAWFTSTIALAIYLPKHTPIDPLLTSRSQGWIPVAVISAWGVALLAFLRYFRRARWRSQLGLTWLGLLASNGLAVMLSAAQLFPVLEFMQQTSRAATTGASDNQHFSIEPFRLLEMLWPNFMGTRFGNHSFWFDALNLPGFDTLKLWVPSLYIGGLTILLAIGAFSLSRGRCFQVAMSWILVISGVGSLGQYTSPIWCTRLALASADSPLASDLSRELGPIDATTASAPIRRDHLPRDSDGSVYWWLSTLLPGFGQFRYPSKLFTFTCLSLAALAGIGWDKAAAGQCRPSVRAGTVCVTISLLTLTLVAWNRPNILATLRHSRASALFGPVSPAAGCDTMLQSLAHASLLLGLGTLIIRSARTRPWLSGTLLLVLMTADLAIANARFILTVPQETFDTKPEIARLIEAAEKNDPSPGPFRVHRMPAWNPLGWSHSHAPDRIVEIAKWEHNTIRPKCGITDDIEFTLTLNFAQLADYEWFFRTTSSTIRSPALAKQLGIDVGATVIYLPRRSIDLWNTRYIVTPAFPNGWNDEQRGYASFLARTDIIYPNGPEFRGPNAVMALEAWADTHDFQILKNRAHLPRAWVVHAARTIAPVTNQDPRARIRSLEEITYNDDYLSHDDRLRAYDPRTLAWIDSADRPELSPYTSGGPNLASERVSVTYPDPQHAELTATLERPGLIVLADIYYPGWELSIDGQPARIYRVNRMMRGAAVGQGHHRLVYSYNPRSFRFGLPITVAGLLTLATLAVLAVAKSAPRLERVANPGALFLVVLAQVSKIVP